MYVKSIYIYDKNEEKNTRPQGMVINSANWTTGAWEGRPVSDRPSWAVPTPNPTP